MHFWTRDFHCDAVKSQAKLGWMEGLTPWVLRMTDWLGRWVTRWAFHRSYLKFKVILRWWPGLQKRSDSSARSLENSFLWTRPENVGLALERACCHLPFFPPPCRRGRRHCPGTDDEWWWRWWGWCLPTWWMAIGVLCISEEFLANKIICCLQIARTPQYTPSPILLFLGQCCFMVN